MNGIDSDRSAGELWERLLAGEFEGVPPTGWRISRHGFRTHRSVPSSGAAQLSLNLDQF
jgi:hypothetical protein